MKISESYLEFYFFRVRENNISIIPASSPRLYDELSNPFYHNGLFLESSNSLIIYHPGTYNSDKIFYKHPIKISADIYLVEINEKDLSNKSVLGLSEAEKEERYNPKGIEIILDINSLTGVTKYSIYTNNHTGIFNAVNSLYYFNLFLQLGFSLYDFNNELGNSCSIKQMERHQRRCYTRIFAFVSQLKFISWGEVISIPRKDNKIESGIKIVNEQNESYFIYLVNKFSDFKSSDGKLFTGKQETDYGYIQCKEYSECEIFGFDKDDLQNEILNAIIKNYDQNLDILYSFFKKPM